jgi:predicted transcriptional regulator of viral defense system
MIELTLFIFKCNFFYHEKGMKSALDKATAIFLRHGSLMRTSEAIKAGVHPATLYAMRDAKQIEQAGRGLFRLANLPPMEEPDLAVVAKKYPAGVVCLVSALAIHQLTTRIPDAVQIAVPPGTRSPRNSHPPVEVFRYSPQTLSMGVEERVIDGVRVKVFGPEKTIADTFKFRNKIGLDAAVEALRAYSKRKDRRFDLVGEFAKACRVRKVIQPYIEALV